MAVPNITQYLEAFQAHSRLLTDPELQKGTVSKNGNGLPLTQCGGVALTFTVLVNSKKFAVKCFHKETNSLAKRYAAISRKLKLLQSKYFVGFNFLEQGIRIDGKCYPIVKMDWAKGETFADFLEKNLNNKIALKNLETSLKELAIFLKSEKISHGDFHAENLMVSENGKSIQLIDYDGMFLEELKSLGCSEFGQINFQHPMRKVNKTFDETLDNFALILLTLALRAIQEKPDLYLITKSSQEGILLKVSDFIDPDSSITFDQLLKVPTIKQDVQNFALICKAPIDKVPTLEDFLACNNIPKPFSHIDNKKILSQLNITQNSDEKTQITKNKPNYQGPYPVIAANNYRDCLKAVGDKVEVIGCVVEVYLGTDFNDNDYAFINFGTYPGQFFRIILWPRDLKAMNARPDFSWEDKWLSVIGLMDPPYNESPSINVRKSSEITFIEEEEAYWRLPELRPSNIQYIYNLPQSNNSNNLPLTKNEELVLIARNQKTDTQNNINQQNNNVSNHSAQYVPSSTQPTNKTITKPNSTSNKELVKSLQTSLQIQINQTQQSSITNSNTTNTKSINNQNSNINKSNNPSTGCSGCLVMFGFLVSSMVLLLSWLIKSIY